MLFFVRISDRFYFKKLKSIKFSLYLVQEEIEIIKKISKHDRIAMNLCYNVPIE